MNSPFGPEGPFSNKNRRVFFRWLRPRVLPAVLVVVGIGILTWLGIPRKTPLTRSEAAVLVLASSALNVAGGAVFGRIGRADPRHARSAVRRLLSLGQVLARAQERLRDSQGETSGSAAPSQIVEAELEDSLAQIKDAINDWNDVHTEALREVVEESATQKGAS